MTLVTPVLRTPLCDAALAGGSPGPVVAANLDSMSSSTGVFTSTSGGPGLVHDGAGQLRRGPHNLAARSQNFADDVWFKQPNVTITADQAVAPDGTLSADLYENGGPSGRAVRQSLPTEVGATYVVSCWIKWCSGATTWRVGLDEVTISDAWARYTTTLVADTTESYFDVFALGSGGDSAFIWGYQAELADPGQTMAGCYRATQASAWFGPRFLHRFDGSGWRNQGLLIEGEATNRVRDCRDLGAAGWSQENGINATRNAQGADHAANGATTLTDAEDGQNGYCEQFISDIPDDSSTNVLSLLVAKDSETARYPRVELRYQGGAVVSHMVWIDTQNGVLLDDPGDQSGTSRIEDLGAWWRVSIALTNNGTSGNTTARIRIRPAAGSIQGTTSSEATGSVVVDFVQFETGAGRASTVIETASGEVTRAADQAEVDLSTLDLASFSFAVIWDAHGHEVDAARVLEFNDGTALNQINISRSGGNVVMAVVTGGVLQTFEALGPWSTGRHKVAVRIAPDDVAGCLDGGAVVRDAAAAVPLVDSLLLGRSIGTSWLNASLRGFTIWPGGLADAALQAQSLRF